MSIPVKDRRIISSRAGKSDSWIEDTLFPTLANLVLKEEKDEVDDGVLPAALPAPHRLE